MNQGLRGLALAALASLVVSLAPVAARAESEDPNVRRGRIYYNTQKYSKAIGELRTAVRKNPRNAEAHLWLGKSYAKTQEFDKAIEHLNEVVKFQPKSEEALRELGTAYYEVSTRALGKGNKEEAAENLKKAEAIAKDLLALNPREKQSYEFLGALAKGKNDLAASLRYLEKVLKIDPEDISTRLELIEILLRQNRVEDARKQCHEVLKINPQLRDPKLTLARIARHFGNKDEAVRILTELIEAKKTEFRAYIDRAMIHLDENRYEEALADANEVLRITNKHPLANYIRGLVYMRLKKLDDAIHELQQASAGLPVTMREKLPAHFWLARCYLMKEDLRAAIEELNTVVKLNPSFTPARLVLASAHLQQGYPDGAINTLNDALHYDKDKKNVEVRRLLGVAYLHKNDHDSALKQFTEMAKQDPGAPRAHQILAGIALAKNDVDSAVGHCLKALDVEPKNVDVHFLLGLAYMRRDRLDGARRQFEHVLELRGRHPGARMNLAAVHLRLREFDLALEQYKSCIEEDPTLTKPRYALARLYILQRKFDKAEDELNQLLKIETEKAKVHLALAELHQAKGEKEKAVAAAKTALATDKKLYAARVFIARLHMDEQNWPAALAELSEALKEDPKYLPAYEAAVIQVYLGRYDEAVKLFEQAKSNDIQRARMAAAASAALQLKEDYRGALASIAEADKEKAQDPLVALQTANIYLAQGDAANSRTLIGQAHYVPTPIRDAYVALLERFAADKTKGKRVADELTRVIFYGSRGWHAQAEQSCKRLLQLAPKNTFAYTVLANVYLATRQSEKEIEIVQRLIDVDPDSPKHRRRLGNLYVRVSRFKDARKQFEKAVELAPADADTRLNLAAYFLRMAQYDLGIEQAKKILEADEKNAQALTILSRCYLADRKFDEAKEALDRLTKLTGASAPGALPFLQRAELDLLEGKLDEAITRYQEAVKADAKSVQARMGLGMALRRKGRINEALQEFKQVLSIDSTNSQALLLLANIYRGTGRLDLAYATCEQAIKISPSAPQARFEMAAIQLARKQYEAAIDEYKAVLKANPADLRARIGVAEALFVSGDHSGAVARLTDLIKQQSKPLPPAMAALVHFYKRDGEIDKAQEQLEALVLATPKLIGAYDLAVLYVHKDKLGDAIGLIDRALKQGANPGLHLARGTALQLQGKLDGAIAAFEEARKASPKNARMASLLANAHLAAGKADQAIATIKSVEVRPELLEAYLDLIRKLRTGDDKARLTANALNQAALYADANWLTLARERYLKLLGELPGNLAVLHLLADIHVRLDEIDKAIGVYEQMRAGRAGYEPALRSLARAYIAKKQPAKAVEMFRLLLKAKPDSVDVKLALATTLQQDKKLGEAIDLYKDIIKKANHPIAYNNLAWIYASEEAHKDIKQAEAFATKAVDLTSADTAAGSAVRDTLCWIYYLTERYDKALTLAQQASEGMPGNAEVHYHLGMIYLARNHRASAARHLTKCLQIDPGFEHKAKVDDAIERIRSGKP